ncbi:hypothetical protein H9Y04_24770 [Streptomyces sp. TRM66268-LWL]|uniref:Uncharacterized protein n=1 Tax=Streptomyces polyasparticus TaxID=2767826 RepID=A0ABR7SKB5_9ACTN|nr:hypothetical protein [Streptomyces polyasparticus]MBC9715759.1 hypothetical protein [Streptomyces polyasparticus]
MIEGRRSLARLGAWFGRASRQAEGELATVEAQITALGIALDEHDFSPAQPGATDAMCADLERALDAYDAAKRAFVGDRDRADALDVLRALDDGHHALACLDARLAGRPLPHRLPLCFFDPRHGRAVRRLPWAPADGAPRNVSVCAACGVRLEERRGTVGGMLPAPRGAVGEGPRRRPVSTAPASTGSEPGYGVAQERVYGRGPGAGQVRLPAVGQPAVLVVHSDGAEQVTVVLRLRGNQRKGYTLGDGFEPVRARVPLQRLGNRQTVRFTVEFRGSDHTEWEAWAELPDAIPEFTERIHGRGGDLVRYTGPGAPAVLHHRGRGEVRLLALDDDLAEWTEAGRGKGDAQLSVHLPGPGVYQVQARGTWVIEARVADGT